MKKLNLILISIILSQRFIFSQGCLPEGITFTTQAQIDNFQTNYPGCTEIEGDVFFGEEEGTDITNFNGLNILNTIDGDIHFYNNDELFSFVGLENLLSIGGSLRIEYNDEITCMSGFDNLMSIGDDLRIENNDSLTALTGLENLQHIGSDANFLFNNELIDLNGLESLTSIGGGLVISGNDKLSDLSGLENLSTIGTTTAGVSITIDNNDMLESLTGFGPVDSIYQIRILYNDLLMNLTGLNNIVTCSHIIITHNQLLQNLDGLENLQTVGEDFLISYNPDLVNILALNNLSIGNCDLFIGNNDLLSDCDIQSICEYLSAGGTIYILNNAPGCNNQTEVEAACLTRVEENITSEELTLFPNPATGFVTINVKGRIPIVKVIICNQLGQRIREEKVLNNMMDISKLNPGIYFIEVITTEWRGRTKLIKH